jgi:hypothetical protein
MGSRSKCRIKHHTSFGRIILAPVVLGVILQSFCISQAAVITVINNSELVNGNTTSPAALMADPGPDGISLPEAMRAALSVSGPHTIIFDPSLKNATIAPTGWLPNLDNGLITIDGDIDDDGTPDITVDGSGSSSSVCFRVLASDITIRGLIIENYTSVGIQVFTDSAQGWPLIERVTLQGNRLSTCWAGITIFNWGQACTIRNIDIKQNEFINNGARGVEISAAFGQSMADNRMESIKITDNIISNVAGDNKIAIFIVGATAIGSANNVIAGLEISDNTIMGHTYANLQISAGNEQNCRNNRIENVVIKGNNIDGSPVTMEIIGGVGSDANGNVIFDLTIEGNTLSGGGIMLVGARGSNAFQNGINTVHIGQNWISGAAANGIFIIAGSDGAAGNAVTQTTIVNNIIVDSTDAGILLHGHDSSTPNNVIDDVNILNNTIVGNGNAWAGGININSKSSTNIITEIKIINTILWNNEGNDAIRGSLTPDVVGCSVLNDPRYVNTNGNFYSFPNFIDLNNNDFHLQKDSPCIDQGDSEAIGLPAIDFEGDRRIFDGDHDGSAAVDIGADEYVWEIRAMPWMPLLLLEYP